MKIAEGMTLEKNEITCWLKFTTEDGTVSFNLDDIKTVGLTPTPGFLNWAKDMLDAENTEANKERLAGFTEKPIWSGCITKKELTEHRVTIPINIGDERNDNRSGDFLNALDALVSYFLSETNEGDDVLAVLLRIHADRLEDKQ